jgi:hypothetical protein
MLCNVCQSIDFANICALVDGIPKVPRRHKHHASFNDLVQAAANGSELCREVRQKQSHSEPPTLSDDYEDTQIYYTRGWNSSLVRPGKRGTPRFNLNKTDFGFYV